MYIFLKRLFAFSLLIMSCLLSHSQIQRIHIETGYYITQWTDVAEEEKLETKNLNAYAVSAKLPVVEIIPRRIYFGTGLKFARRGSTITGSYYADNNNIYTHKIKYSALEVPLFFEFRQPILKYRYHYNNSIYDKLAISVRIGADLSFLLSSDASVYLSPSGKTIEESVKAFTEYSPRINDVFHHVSMSIGCEYYINNNYGVSIAYGLDRSKALTKLLNHPFFDKTLYYKPVDASFSEQSVLFSIGGIYRF